MLSKALNLLLSLLAHRNVHVYITPSFLGYLGTTSILETAFFVYATEIRPAPKSWSGHARLVAAMHGSVQSKFKSQVCVLLKYLHCVF